MTTYEVKKQASEQASGSGGEEANHGRAMERERERAVKRFATWKSAFLFFCRDENQKMHYLAASKGLPESLKRFNAHVSIAPAQYAAHPA